MFSATQVSPSPTRGDYRVLQPPAAPLKPQIYSKALETKQQMTLRQFSTGSSWVMPKETDGWT